MRGIIARHQDLDVYRKAFEAAKMIFEISKTFPKEETYSLSDQIRRSSRLICSNIAKAWRKRRYIASFISKISGSEGEAAQKLQPGLNLLFAANILMPKLQESYSKLTAK
jgi:four helix bundle protein